MEILLENPLTIVFLIGIIYTIFSKKKSDQEKEKKRQQYRQQQKTRYQGAKPLQQPVLPQSYSSKNENAQRERKPAKRRTETAERTSEREYQENKSASEKRIRELQEKHAQIARQVIQLARMKEKFPQGAAGRKKLAEAVIWAEILGEPRAKKPHFSSLKK
ncbi:hypothetical protein J9303_05245 [Bacillaceae bacterium Marseille-Q3522]|nr:hypothetical protein [Bacillaceae bacterium Marseille-Q3522]